MYIVIRTLVKVELSDVNEVADDDTKAIVDIKLDKINEKYSDRVLPMALE